MENAQCYLVGGAPRTGKTTLAERIATKHGVKSLSTDSISVIMTKLVRRKDYPNLFYKQGLTVEEFYKKYDTPAKEVAAGVKAGYDTEVATTAIIEHTLPAWKVIVVEGAFITPGFVRRFQEKYPKLTIHPTFLFDDNKGRIKELIYAKGLWGHNAKPYPDAIKLKEIEYVVAYNEWFLNEIERYGFDITKVR
ncbi:MAG TPA: hypothetical protein VFO38_02275 [Candidatus Saccharimonadales bacterium]|nr:hypothetical protein [Candidatus Saccharimonadales bacterium]